MNLKVLVLLSSSLILCACTGEKNIISTEPVSFATESGTIKLDNNNNDWEAVATEHLLTDKNGDEASISFKVTHDSVTGQLYALLSAPMALKKIDVFLDPTDRAVLDRPVQYSFDGNLSAAQAMHAQAVTMEAVNIDTGFAQEWEFNLGGLNSKLSQFSYADIGFDVEVITEDDRIFKWGHKDNKWLFNRRLRRISLVPDNAKFGELDGKVRWSNESASPSPQRVILKKKTAPQYVKFIEADPDTGDFSVIVPAGEYKLTANDSRSLPSLSGEQNIIVPADNKVSVPAISIAQPNRANMEQLINEEMGQQNIKALGLVYIRDGQVELSKVFGVRPDGSSASEDKTIFKMASVAKSVAALTVLSLVDKGLWSLDEPLAEYWVDPGIKDDPRHKQITTRMVLQHTSGLPNQSGSEGLEFLYDPLDRQSYSGEGYRYLQRAVEKKFGRPFQKIAEEYVFVPVGMTCSSFQGPKESCGEYAQKFHNNYQFDPPSWDDADVKGGWMTTIKDMEAFLTWIINGAGLSSETWGQITTANGAELIKGEETSKDLYGLGFVVSKTDGLVLSHGGSEFGARTYLVVLPEKKSGVLVATNASSGLPAIRMILEATLKQENSLTDLEASLTRAENFEW